MAAFLDEGEVEPWPEGARWVLGVRDVYDTYDGIELDQPIDTQLAFLLLRRQGSSLFGTLGTVEADRASEETAIERTLSDALSVLSGTADSASLPQDMKTSLAESARGVATTVARAGDDWRIEPGDARLRRLPDGWMAGMHGDAQGHRFVVFRFPDALARSL